MNDRLMIILTISALIITLIVGFRNSYLTGIQPGYFEKTEAPAYGVGGGELLGAGMDEEFQKYLKELNIKIEDE